MLLFRQLFDKKSSTYTYLLADTDGGEAVLIDPVLDQLDAYFRLLDELRLTLRAAVDTHVHADHITALGPLRDKLGCMTFIGRESGVSCASGLLTEGEHVKFGRYGLTAWYTPGHTSDCYSLLLSADGRDYVFTGDTLLIRGTGRTDFQNGDAGRQYDSLFGRLLTLPDETLVYPAHDYKGWTVSTIAEERAHNPRLQVADRASYIRQMNNLHLPNPGMLDVAVPANRHCGEATAGAGEPATRDT
jgi:glyoxylase-like metal-dependent hydrolase (beta-lactamase superfamily II)